MAAPGPLLRREHGFSCTTTIFILSTLLSVSTTVKTTTEPNESKDIEVEFVNDSIILQTAECRDSNNGLTGIDLIIDGEKRAYIALGFSAERADTGKKDDTKTLAVKGCLSKSTALVAIGFQSSTTLDVRSRTQSLICKFSYMSDHRNGSALNTSSSARMLRWTVPKEKVGQKHKLYNFSEAYINVEFSSFGTKHLDSSKMKSNSLEFYESASNSCDLENTGGQQQHRDDTLYLLEKRADLLSFSVFAKEGSDLLKSLDNGSLKTSLCFPKPSLTCFPLKMAVGAKPTSEPDLEEGAQTRGTDAVVDGVIGGGVVVVAFIIIIIIVFVCKRNRSRNENRSQSAGPDPEANNRLNESFEETGKGCDSSQPEEKPICNLRSDVEVIDMKVGQPEATPFAASCSEEVEDSSSQLV